MTPQPAQLYPIWLRVEDNDASSDKHSTTVMLQPSHAYVPEPYLMLLLGLGLGAVTLVGWRFKH